MKYKYEYTILDNNETLLIYENDDFIYKKEYIRELCLRELLDNPLIELDQSLRAFTMSFIEAYADYCITKDFNLIQQYLLIASSHKVHMGYIPNDKFIEMRFETNDVKKLIYFIMLQTVSKKIYIKKISDISN